MNMNQIIDDLKIGEDFPVTAQFQVRYEYNETDGTPVYSWSDWSKNTRKYLYKKQAKQFYVDIVKPTK